MRRLCVWAMVLGAAALVSGRVAYAKTGTFTVPVAGITEFITSIETNASSATNIATWDVDNDAGGTGVDTSDAVIAFRLVTNQNVTLTGSFDHALQQDLGGGVLGQLLTYANLVSDGAGTGTPTAGATHDTGTTSTGILAAAASANYGVGSGNFGYIGGVASGSPDAPAGTYGTTTEAFLHDATGITVTHIDKDGAAKLTVTVRGMNAEDYGADADNTEAPDSGSYSCILTLTATP